jgi:hypothetical protein
MDTTRTGGTRTRATTRTGGNVVVENKTATGNKQKLFELLDKELTEKQVTFLVDLLENYQNPIEKLLENEMTVKFMLKRKK